ncbi:DUF1932 domain-containing protein [Halalkalibacter akibai]|uniref:Phosphogluconate dehydrogenase n=1 Tax=Halalkalibacter akibai (strain ATCC 43226 / DSM 21942 / CIP 109018 / JCM 9157 / 1139) TaxID=1236973 RepID=W4QSE1_HALA3|nr:DUF1932 domain-containing protein [Halalkalibacter akibai]GAE35030.1 hypothetical protein JCM9157_2123 [Halalkalibacter akibai JCM 9157]
MKIGFIGFGEAAYHISSGLQTEEVERIHTFDINVDHPSFGSKIKERAEELNIVLEGTLKDLISHSDVIICATSAKFALSIAKEAVPFLTEDKIYVDINATSPMVKEEIEQIVSSKCRYFVDGAVVESIPNYKHKVPILVSGKGASEFIEVGKCLGMNLTRINDKPGSASAIKMSRSIFMKGFTMLLLETLSLSNKYDVAPLIMESLNQSITGKYLEVTANNLLNRTAIHAERRVTELEEVIKTLEEANVNSLMSQATKEKLSYLVQLELNKFFNYEQPQNYADVVAAINSIEK